MSWPTRRGALAARHALEVRNAHFAHEQCFDILRAHGMALVVSDGAGRWPLLQELTADIVYIRLHGHSELYSSQYSSQSLGRWARLIDEWMTGSSAPDGRRRDVYVYFDNDARGHAPHDAPRLQEQLRRRSTEHGHGD